MTPSTTKSSWRAHAACAALIMGLGALAGCGRTALPTTQPLASPGHALTAFVFLSTECPLSQNYTRQLDELRSAYDATALDMVGVFPLSDDDEARVRAFCEKYPVGFPTRLDHEYVLVDALHASVTPEVFLLDAQDTLIYSGKIDNWAVELGQTRRVATVHYLKDAIDAHLQDSPVPVDHIDPVGCLLPEDPYIAQTE